MTKIEDPALPAGSLVLVTGVNGFIGSHVVNELLLNGYRVRGTVRDVSKASWVQPLYDSLHGDGKFELVEVKDLTAEGAYDEVLNGTHSIIRDCFILLRC
jgi:nucleoside-diphosphate-sugar epimerase